MRMRGESCNRQVAALYVSQMTDFAVDDRRESTCMNVFSLAHTLSLAGS